MEKVLEEVDVEHGLENASKIWYSKAKELANQLDASHAELAILRRLESGYRAEFAKAAMQGMLAAKYGEYPCQLMEIVSDAIYIADGLLNELTKEPST